MKNKQDTTSKKNTNQILFPPTCPYMLPYMEKEEEINLYELYLILKKRKKIIFVFTIGFFILGILMVIRTKPLYKVSSKILPLQYKRVSFNYEIKASQSKKILEAILNSRELRIRLVKQLNLFPYFYSNKTSQKKTFIYKIKQKIKNILNRKTIEKPPTIYDIADGPLKNSISIVSNEESETITINTYFTNPVVAYKINVGVLNITRQIINEKTFTLAKAYRIYLEKQLKQVKKRLKQVEEKFFKFAKKYGILDVEFQTSYTTEEYSSLKQQIILLETQLKAMREFLTTNDPQVKALQRQIYYLKKELKRLEAQEKKNKFSPEIPFGLAPEIVKKYINLKRELKVTQKVYSALKEEYEIAKANEQKERIAFQTVDPPYIPTRPVNQKTKFKIVVATLIGFVLGIIVALFKEWIDNIKRKYESEDIK